MHCSSQLLFMISGHHLCIGFVLECFKTCKCLDDIVNLCLSFLFPRETKSSRENACWPISNKLKIWECDVARNKLRRIGMLGIDLKLWGVTSRDRPLSQFGIWGPPPSSSSSSSTKFILQKRQSRGNPWHSKSGNVCRLDYEYSPLC